MIVASGLQAVPGKMETNLPAAAAATHMPPVPCSGLHLSSTTPFRHVLVGSENQNPCIVHSVLQADDFCCSGGHHLQALITYLPQMKIFRGD